MYTFPPRRGIGVAVTATIINGWLFDVYPSSHGVVLWLIDREGRTHRVSRPFTPSFFLHLSRTEAEHARKLLRAFPCPVEMQETVRRELFSNQEWAVHEVAVLDPTRLQQAVRKLEHHFPHFVFFNSDIPVSQMFLYTSGLFPLAYGDYVIGHDNVLLDWVLSDTREAMQYSLPPLVTMTLRNRPDCVSPKYRKSFQIEVGYDDAVFSLESEEPGEILHSLNNHLKRCDPDIIASEYGDAILLPMLARLASDLRIPLLLNRDEQAGYVTTKESSYFVYGKMVHKDGAFELAGRWHLDCENSFLMDESQLDGIVEIARLTQLPVQQQSRSSIGTALASMQFAWAVRNNCLIPAKKREPEDFKSAATLLLADRGGIIFQPLMGYHEQVAELDFVSMYPNIMVQHNVSPETVNCRCCNNEAVPELQYTICTEREGIVPATLRPVVERRSYYKRQKKHLKRLGDEGWRLYDHRQNALKWILVTCFGYLGYKNARFGKIEAHESVNAFSREKILQAKEIAEREGFQFLHAIVDCMWVKKEGATEEDYERLCRDVTAATHVEISLEGIYNWLLFPSSKIDPMLPTANRYVGFYSDGDIKVRGIEVRRRDTPKFIKRMQGEMLQAFKHATCVAEVKASVPAALITLKEFLGLLSSGQVDPLDLVIRRNISKEAHGYMNKSISAVVAKTLDEAGVKLKPGERIEYIILDASGKKKPEKAKPLAFYSFDEGYDIEKYTELALKAAETLLLPFGYDTERLGKECGVTVKGRRVLKSPVVADRNNQLAQTDNGTLDLFTR